MQSYYLCNISWILGRLKAGMGYLRSPFWICNLPYLLLILTVPGRALAHGSNLELPWLAFGDHRGHVEPCGCDPSTDLGGLRRLGSLVKKERVLTPQLHLFALGNLLVAGGSGGAQKNQLMLEALAALAPTATLFNLAEQRAIKDDAAAVQGLLQKVSLVLSHASDGKLPIPIRSSIVTDNAIVLGYAQAPNGSPWTRPLSKELLAEWRTLLEKAPARLMRVLLFSGTDAELLQISQSGLFQLILRSAPEPLDGWEVPIDQDAGALFAKPIGVDSDVRTVPLAGRGVLRGGKLEKSVALPLSALLSADAGRGCADRSAFPLNLNCQPRVAEELNEMLTAQRVTWLQTSYEDGHPFAELFSQYQRNVSNHFGVMAEAKGKLLAQTPFAGSEACATCHPAAYKSWKNSKHAHAIDILKLRGKTEDPECVGCHVLGFDVDGGFASLSRSPQFANVNCENCHGARLQHTTNPSLQHDPKPISEETCRTCHQGEHSPQFNFESYWSKIFHGRG